MDEIGPESFRLAPGMARRYRCRKSCADQNPWVMLGAPAEKSA